MRPVPIQPSFSVWVGNWQILCGVERNDLGAFRREDDFLLDARGRNTVGRGAIGLDGEYHAGLELDRLAQRRQARDERPLMQAEPEAVAEVEAEGIHLARKPDVLCFGQRAGDLVR